MAGGLKRSWDMTRLGCHANGDRYLRSAGNPTAEFERRGFLETIEAIDSNSVASFVDGDCFSYAAAISWASVCCARATISSTRTCQSSNLGMTDPLRQ